MGLCVNESVCVGEWTVDWSTSWMEMVGVYM